MNETFVFLACVGSVLHSCSEAVVGERAVGNCWVSD